MEPTNSDHIPSTTLRENEQQIEPRGRNDRYYRHQTWRRNEPSRGYRGRNRTTNKNLSSNQNITTHPSNPSNSNNAQDSQTNLTTVHPDSNCIENESNENNDLQTTRIYNSRQNNFRGGRGRGSRRLRPTLYATKDDIRNNPHKENLDNDRGLKSNQQKQFLLPRRGGRNLYHLNDNRESNLVNTEPNAETSTNSSDMLVLETHLSCKRESNQPSIDTECVICCDNISRYNPIWSCSNCYCIIHLKCAIEWCNKSIKSRNEALASSNSQDYTSQRMNTVEWPCPTCREILYSRPGKYKCFCRKVIRPEPSRFLAPHSCGNICGRKRGCSHNCPALCHPGPCSKCSLTSKKPCHCGGITKEVKCSVSLFSCDNICDKFLKCGIHKCKNICHPGPCEQCIEEIKCHCGESQKLCIEFNNQDRPKDKPKSSFSCEKKCMKLLDCSQHYCEKNCHASDCNSCKFLSQNIKTCPCGSTLIKKSLLTERKLCTDPIPTCSNKCNQILVCGPDKNNHRCFKKCHDGSCPPCKLKTTVHCECKLSTKTIDCSLMYEKVELNHDQVQFKQIKYTFSCESKCNKFKNCKRHRCENKCCKYLKTSDPNIHKCTQKCNKKLACNSHICLEICGHPGTCGDCPNIGWNELTCHCGSSILYPPIPCGSRPPACDRPCRRAHDCGHPVRHNCHDDLEKCPPCCIFVEKQCFCGAESKKSVYCYLPGYSCGRTCKKPLKCGHQCQKVCHDNICREATIQCKQLCQVTRFLCKHPCALLCHGKSPCPPSPCSKIIELSCSCGNKTEKIECYKITKDIENRNKVAMMNTARSNQDTIIVDLSKQASKSTDVSNNDSKILECDDKCSIFKRNKALAEALDIAQPDLKPKGVFGEDPLLLLKEATAKDYKFVSATFNTLAKFVKTAKESEKRFIFMQFPPADKLRREVIHELAYHFNCTSESIGDEGDRYVLVKAHKNKALIPEFSIEQLLPISD